VPVASDAKRGLISSVTVVEAPAAQRPVLDHLLQLYKYDFSEFAPIGSPYGEVDEEGGFAYPGLERYWQESGRIPLLIHANDRLAGFVLVQQWSALERPLDYGVAEFFVLRKYRQARVGARAALLVFRRYPGRWEVPVAWYNPPAQAGCTRLPAPPSGRGSGERPTRLRARQRGPGDTCAAQRTRRRHNRAAAPAPTIAAPRQSRRDDRWRGSAEGCVHSPASSARARDKRSRPLHRPHRRGCRSARTPRSRICRAAASDRAPAAARPAPRLRSRC